MRFWDSSALVPLLVPEAMSPSMQELYERDPIMIAWWATEIECTSAIARRQRLGQFRRNRLNPCGIGGARGNPLPR